MSMYDDPDCPDCAPGWPCWRHKRRKMTFEEYKDLSDGLNKKECGQHRGEKKQLDNDPKK